MYLDDPIDSSTTSPLAAVFGVVVGVLLVIVVVGVFAMAIFGGGMDGSATAGSWNDTSAGITLDTAAAPDGVAETGQTLGP